MKTFLNRLLGLTTTVQNRFFKHFNALFEDEIAKDKAENKYDDGVVDMAANSGIELKNSIPFYTDPTTKARSTLYTLNLDRGMGWNAALAELQAANAREAAEGNANHINGFYEEVFGQPPFASVTRRSLYPRPAQTRRLSLSSGLVALRAKPAKVPVPRPAEAEPSRHRPRQH